MDQKISGHWLWLLVENWNPGFSAGESGGTRWNLSGPFHKYGHVRCAQFSLWQGARRAHTPQSVCNRRATQRQAKLRASLPAAVLFRPDVVSPSLLIHYCVCSALAACVDVKTVSAD